MAYKQYGGAGAAGFDEYEEEQQQRGPAAQFNIRPVVDPEAEGEVDPNL